MNILVTIIAIPLVFIIRDKPPSPPSKVAQKKPIVKEFFIQSKEALHDHNFRLMLAVITLINGTFLAFGACVSIIFSSIFNSGGIALLSGGSIVFGVISAFIVGIILKKTRKNLLITQICSFSSVLVTIS